MTVRILQGDCLQVLKTLGDESVHCCVTSPPYWGLRDYGVAGQLGLESSPQEYVERMVMVFREVKRVLRDDGTLWLNLGDSYAAGRGGTAMPAETLAGGVSGRGQDQAFRGRVRQVPDNKNPNAPIIEYQPHRNAAAIGLKHKDLVGIPWRVAFALQADGWYLRQDIIWAKPNPMPESVRDRCTKAHEYIFLLSKSERYHYDAEAIAEEAIHPEITHQSSVVSDLQSAAFMGNAPTNLGRCGTNKDGTRNKRSVWTVSTQPFSEAHFATFPPALIEPCILAGCPPAGKRCDCDQIISTPTGSGLIDDPSLLTGRAGMNRPRRPNEGTRPITRREQRWHAEQMRQSPRREKMRLRAGEAFDHYVRTDDSGARPLPEAFRAEWLRLGWITDAPPCTHSVEPAGTVLDPFAGAGTTGLVADRLQRDAILIELNESYCEMARKRLVSDAPLFAEIT